MRLGEWARAGLLLTAALTMTACGSDDPGDGTSAASSSSEATGSTLDEALFGEWVTVNECQPYVDALSEAGLEEFAAVDSARDHHRKPAKMIGIGAGKDPSDPCKEAQAAEHSHTLDQFGKFTSHDASGEKVDFGTYEIIDEDTFTLSRIPFETLVDYNVDGDTATFEVVLPECAEDDEECRYGAALGIATFYPETYERAK